MLPQIPHERIHVIVSRPTSPLGSSPQWHNIGRQPIASGELPFRDRRLLAPSQKRKTSRTEPRCKILQNTTHAPASCPWVFRLGRSHREESGIRPYPLRFVPSCVGGPGFIYGELPRWYKVSLVPHCSCVSPFSKFTHSKLRLKRRTSLSRLLSDGPGPPAIPVIELPLPPPRGCHPHR